VEFDWLTYEEILTVVDEMREDVFYRNAYDLGIKKLVIHPAIMTHLMLHLNQNFRDIRTGQKIYKFFNHSVTVDSTVPGYLIE
jgi:hypothetical protein